MNSHNTRPQHAFHKTPLAKPDNRRNNSVVASTLTVQAELTLDDDNDPGTDPYNATGQHVVLPEHKAR